MKTIRLGYDLAGRLQNFLTVNCGTTHSARDTPDPDSQALIGASSSLPVSEDRNSALAGV